MDEQGQLRTVSKVARYAAKRAQLERLEEQERE
jgi:hypothetical protein